MVEEMVGEPIDDAIEDATTPTTKVDSDGSESLSSIDRDRLWAQLMFGVRIGVDIDVEDSQAVPAEAIYFTSAKSTPNVA